MNVGLIRCLFNIIAISYLYVFLLMYLYCFFVQLH
jgi:hypothetical protein